MIIYVVEPPPEDNAGDDEDTREWFGTLAAARTRYRELVKTATAFIKAREAAKADPDNDELLDISEKLNPEWKFMLIRLIKYDIPLKKRELIHALNHQLAGCGEVLEEWNDNDR
jgi:hypothetical protein